MGLWRFPKMGVPQDHSKLDHLKIDTHGDLGDPKNGVPPKSSKIDYLVGGFNPSEKYESQLGWLFPIYGKKHVPNHQPVIIGKPMVWGTNIPHFNVQKPPFSPAKGQRSHRGTRIERCLRPPSVGCSECPGQPIFGPGTSSSGWWFQPLWKIWKSVESVGIIIPNIWKNNKCSKPPTSDRIIKLSNCKIEVSCVLLCINSY